MNKKIIVLTATVLSLGTFVANASFAQAYRGDPLVKGPNYSEERHIQMEVALNNNDYNAWKTLMAGRGRVLDVVTADNFSQFAKARTLAEEGKLEEANKIRAELGLGQGIKGGEGRGMGFRGQK